MNRQPRTPARRWLAAMNYLPERRAHIGAVGDRGIGGDIAAVCEPPHGKASLTQDKPGDAIGIEGRGRQVAWGQRRCGGPFKALRSP